MVVIGSRQQLLCCSKIECRDGLSPSEHVFPFDVGGCFLSLLALCILDGVRATSAICSRHGAGILVTFVVVGCCVESVGIRL